MKTRLTMILSMGVWCLLANQSLFSQALQIRNYNLKDGLPQSEVYAVYQDHLGFIWFGTYEMGVARYDGKKIKIYSKERGLKNPSIRSIAEDREGNIWVGTDGGLVCITRKDSIFTFTTSHGLPSNRIRALAEDRSGNLWIGTGNGVVRRNTFLQKTSRAYPDVYLSNQFQSYKIPGGRESNQVYAIEIAEDGKIWIGTTGGLYLLKSDHFRNGPVIEKLADRPVRSLLSARNGDLWIGTFSDVIRIEGSDLDAIPETIETVGSRVYSIAQDVKDNVWIGTRNYLAKYDGERLVKYDTRHGLPSNDIRSICVDYENNIWLGTSGGGAGKIYGRYLENYTKASGLMINTVYSLMQDREGRIWIGTNGGGIGILENNSIRLVTTDDGLPDNQIRGLAQSQTGDIWAATQRGAGRFRNGTWRSFKTKDGLPSELLTSVYISNENEIWFGSFRGGAIRFKDGKFSNTTTASELPSQTVYQVLKDSQGRLWIATQSGLYMEKGNESIVYDHTNGLPDSSVYCMFEDHAGALWFGTRLGGAVRYVDGEFETFDMQRGLPNNIVYFIVEDDRHHIWFGTNAGVTRFDGKEFTTIRASNGLASDECNTRAALCDLDGQLWFGTVGGATCLNPYRFPGSAPPPKVNIFSLASDRHNFDRFEKGDFQEDYGAALTFHFGALSFINEDGNTYRVMLDGFDQDWIDHGTDRSIRYTNVPPGEYTFRVKAANVLGIESENVASVAVRILPPFYRTSWFIGAVILLVVGLIYGTHLLRVRNMRAHARELQQAVAEKTQGLQEAHAFLETIKEFLPIGLMVIGSNRFIIDANQEAEELFGFKEDEIKGQEIHNFLSSPILNRDEVWKTLCQKRSQLELIGLHRSGKRFVCQIHTDHVDDTNGQMSYLILTCEDIEERKHLEARLIENEKQLAISDLLAGVGDVLNNRLSGVQGYMDMLKGELGESGRADPEKVIKWIQDAVQDMSKVLKQLIDCSSYLVKAPVVYSDLRKELDSLKERWDDRIDIQLLRATEPIPIKVVRKFRNGLDEAILNSIDAGATKVNIEVERSQNQERAQILITDNGKGVSPEYVNKVFLPFFRMKGTSHSGLGLWKLYQVVKQCGGKVELVTMPQGGAQLRILLPLVEDKKAQQVMPQVTAELQEAA